MKRAILTLLLGSCLCVGLGCAKKQQTPRNKTTLIYFGFEDRSEKPEDVMRLAKTWGKDPPCPNWRATIDKKNANYQVLFGKAESSVSEVTIIDRKGTVLYSGGEGVMYLPNGNPDGSGVNICKLTR